MHQLLFGLIIVSNLLAQAAFAADTPAINYDFCTLDGVAATTDDPQIWSAPSVQHNGRRLLANPDIIDSPRASYPLAYVALTHERDVERCGGSLGSDDRDSRLIGDLLADLMSRWLMKSVAACSDSAVTSAQVSPDDYGLCAAVQRQKGDGDDSLKATVDMTAVYLTSHMGMALAAVAFDDAFWNQEYPTETHCAANAPCGRDVLEARLAVIGHYKELYNKNNQFLADNLATVIDTLHDACYLQGDAIPLGARLAALLPAGDVFADIRDQTFAAALATARLVSPSEHPMIAREGGLNVAQYRTFRTFKTMPAPLRDAETHARQILAGDQLTWLFEPFGSLSERGLKASRPSQNASCNYPQLVN